MLDQDIVLGVPVRAIPKDACAEYFGKSRVDFPRVECERRRALIDPRAELWNEITGPIEFGLQASVYQFSIDRYFEPFVPGDTIARGGASVIRKGHMLDPRCIGWCFSRSRIVVQDAKGLLRFASQEVLAAGTWQQPDLHPFGVFGFGIIEDLDADGGERFTGCEVEKTGLGFRVPMLRIQPYIERIDKPTSEGRFEGGLESSFGRT